MDSDRKTMGRKILNYSFADPLGAPVTRAAFRAFFNVSSRFFESSRQPTKI